MINILKLNELFFLKQFRVAFNRLLTLPRFEKIMTFYWLLGPFIYLIERDPADFWLTSIVLIFLIRCSIKND